VRLSHWDFRPKRRNRYVAVGSAAGRPDSLWKRPGFRILLLGAFGVLVYLEYDAVVQSSLLQSLSRPSDLWKAGMEKIRFQVAPPPPAEHRGVLSADSSAREWSCLDGGDASCISAWSGLDEEEKGRIRVMVRKARLAWGAPESTEVRALFRKGFPGAAPEGMDPGGASGPIPGITAEEWRLSRVRMDWPQGSLILSTHQDSEGREQICRLVNGKREDCLDRDPARTPVRTYQAYAPSRERPPTLDFAAPAGETVHPILPGRVVALPADSAGWLKLHHGGSLFSFYAGFEPAEPRLSVGAPVRLADILGRALAPDTAASEPPALRLRIEQDGSPLDPLAFLGLESDSLHGR
jgi:hypothetical protein